MNYKMQYKKNRKVTGRTIVYNSKEIKGDVLVFINFFDLDKSIEWNECNEKIIIDKFSNVLDFLLKHNYVEEVKNEIVYNPSKIYCTRSVRNIYKLGKIVYNYYDFYAINSNNGCWSNNKFSDPQDCIDHAIKLSNKIDIFDSHEEMIEHYFPKKDNKLSKQEEINLMYDLVKKYYNIANQPCKDIECGDCVCSECNYNFD